MHVTKRTKHLSVIPTQLCTYLYVCMYKSYAFIRMHVQELFLTTILAGGCRCPSRRRKIPCNSRIGAASERPKSDGSCGQSGDVPSALRSRSSFPKRCYSSLAEMPSRSAPAAGGGTASMPSDRGLLAPGGASSADGASGCGPSPELLKPDQASAPM